MQTTGDLKKDCSLYREVCDIQTLRSESDGFFTDFSTIVKNAIGMKWIETVFKQIDNDEDRLRAIYTTDILKEHVHETLTNVDTLFRDKDPVMAKMRRMDAAEMVRKGQYESALSFVNLSILRAPANYEWEAVDYGGSLLFGYMKRAEIFTFMKDFKNAFEDLCLAEETNNVPPRMRNIIREKKEELKKRIENSKLYPIEVTVSPNDVPIYPTFATNRQLPTINSGNNPKLLNASAKLDIRQTENAGKEIYATAEIVPGEVLLIEEPSVCFLLQKYYGTHCQECLERLYAPVGCPNCSGVAFCSRKCRDIALSTYHKYECKLLSIMTGSGMSVLCFLAYRAITQEGLDNCLKIYDAINKKKTDENNEENEENERKLSRSARRRKHKKKMLIETTSQTNESNNLIDNLSSVSLKDEEPPINTILYELENHNSERTAKDYFERTLMTAFLLKCLQRTNFFRTTSADHEFPNKEEIMVASLILKNILSFQFNAHMIFESTFRGANLLENRTAVNIALAIYPTVSRFNHECVPVLGRYHNGKKVVIRSLKTFQPGDTIPENYGPNIDQNGYIERQINLWGRYWFKCTCKACEEKWPTAEHFKNHAVRLKCLTKGCTKLHNVNKIQDRPIFCNLCRKKVNMPEVLSSLHACEMTYQRGFELIDINEISKSIEYLTTGLTEFYKIAVPPHDLTHRAQMMLNSLFGYFGNTYRFPEIKQNKFHSTPDDSNTIPDHESHKNSTFFLAR